MRINFTKYLKKGRPLTITLIYTLVYFIIIFIFSNFFITTITSNTKVLFLVEKYRVWVYFAVSVILVFIILRKQMKMFVRVDEVLKQTEDSYQILVENLKEDYFFYRHDRDQVFQNISPSIKTILGISSNEFKTNYKQYHAESLAGDYILRHSSLFESGLRLPSFEVEVLNSKKEKRILEVKEIPIIDENNDIIAIEGLARDITDYKKFEIEIKDKENKFKLLFESANDAILILKGDKVIDCNSKTLEMFECTIDKIIMQSIYSYKFSPITQSDGRSSKELSREKLFDTLKGEPQYFEWTHLKFNGDAFETDVSLTLFNYDNEEFIIAIIRDITEKKRAENLLRQSEESFRDMYETSVVGLFRTKISDGSLIYGNQVAAEILGFSNIQDAIDQNFKVSSLYSKKRRGEMLDELNSKGFIKDFEIHQTFEDGSENYISISAKMFPKKDFIEGIVYDITDKKLANILIEEKERKFKEIIDNSRAILYKLNAHDGSYSYMSPSCYNILGYYPEELLKMSIEEQRHLIHPDDQIRAHSIMAKLVASMPKSKTSYTVEYRLKHKNGGYRWLSDRYSIIKDEKEKTAFIIGNIIDITEEKESQLALKESELRFRNMAATIKNGVTINENGKNVYVNDRMTEITGYSVEELMAFSEFQISAPEEKKRLQKIILDLQQSKTKIEEIEFWIIRKDGSKRCILNKYSYNDVDDKKEVKYIITSDITERKLMESTLRESEEKFRELANTLPHTIFESDVNGKVTYVNRLGLKIFGLSEKEIEKGLSIYDMIIPEEVEQAKSNFEKLIAGKNYQQFEYNVKTKDNSIISVLYYPSLIYKDEEIVGIRAIVIDTTNEKRIQEELIVAQEAAKAANKAKSIFLTNLTQELRNPMNSIFGMTELIKKTALSDKQYDFLKVITESSENLLSILNDILVIPKIESGDIYFEKSPYKLQDVLISVVGLISYQAEIKKLKIVETQKFQDNLVVLGDPSRLTQIIVNIAEYAIKNTETGQIEAKFECIDENKDNATIEFSILDSSKGLPAKILNALKAEFEKSHLDIYSEYGSSGLGLIVANKLISLMGSSLSIETNEKGVKYSFKLKLRKRELSDLEKISAETQENKEKYLKNVRILLVEDELFNQLVIKSMIEEWDCEIDAVYSGEEALVKIDEKIYDIVLMDIIMPEMNGIETAKLIRKLPVQHNANLPIVAITANDDALDHKEYLKSGIDYAISKPFKSSELFHALVKGLGISRQEEKEVKSQEPVKKKDEKTSANKLYDLKIVENIAKNNKILIVKMIRTFIEKTKIEIVEMEETIANNDWQTLGNIAHKMKPAVAYMGIKNIDELIKFIHHNAKERKQLDKINETFIKLKDLLEKVLVSMENDILIYDNQAN